MQSEVITGKSMKSLNPVRIGVIGVGNMGQRHCRVYSTLRRVQLVGVYDPNFELGRRVAQQYDITCYNDLDQLLAQVDAVSLVTPTPFHFDLAMQCLERGIHMLVEKPITKTVEQAEILTRATEQSELVVQVGHIERFNPTFLELKNVLDDVSPLVINFRRLSPYQGSNTDVDVVLDLMIHDLDLVLGLMGREPDSVEASGLTVFSGAIDHAVAQLYFDRGPLITVTASRITEQKVRQIEVTAKKSYLEGDLLNKSILVHRRTIGEYLNHNQRGGKYRQESIVERIHVPIVEPLFLELEHFVESIIDGKPSLIPACSGLKALRWATIVQNIIHKRLIDGNSFVPSGPGEYGQS